MSQSASRCRSYHRGKGQRCLGDKYNTGFHHENGLGGSVSQGRCKYSRRTGVQLPGRGVQVTSPQLSRSRSKECPLAGNRMREQIQQGHPRTYHLSILPSIHPSSTSMHLPCLSFHPSFIYPVHPSIHQLTI